MGNGIIIIRKKFHKKINIILFYIKLYIINKIFTMDVIYDPFTLKSVDLFSTKGLNILKSYVRSYINKNKNKQYGGSLDIKLTENITENHK